MNTQDLAIRISDLSSFEGYQFDFESPTQLGNKYLYVVKFKELNQRIDECKKHNDELFGNLHSSTKESEV